jgi:hypothetical protein
MAYAAGVAPLPEGRSEEGIPMTETARVARCERRHNYRTLRAIGWTPAAAREWLDVWGRRAAMARACALLANEPGGWTLDAYGDAEYVTVGR